MYRRDIPQEPLTNRELRILRGMIDEYTYRISRRNHRTTEWTKGKVIVTTLAAVYAMALQTVTLIMLIRGGK